MAIDKGSIKASYNYEVTMDKPFDARTVKPSKASLFDKESWSYDGDSIYIYEGMQVFVEDERKTYVLVDKTKFDTEEGWELLGTGASSEVEQVEVIDALDSTRTDAALSANQGRILKDRIEKVEGEATRIYNIKGSTKYEDLPMEGNKVGDVYNITDDFTLGGVSYPAGTNVVWEGSNWDALGGSIDLSAYAKTEEVTTMVQTETQRAQGAEKILQATTTNLWTAVNGKVEKVSGKGLSTEDFTAVLKAKLEGLENYDDAELQEKVTSLQTQLDTLTNSDDLEEVIAKYEELKAFLEGLGNDEYGTFIEEISQKIAALEGNLKTTNSRIDGVLEDMEDIRAEKQNVLVSGVSIKNINGQSLLGPGNIEIGSGGGILVINSDKDFQVTNTESTIVTIKDDNITHAKVKDAVDNGHGIVLKEPRGNISYAVRADYVGDRILVYFSKSIGEIIYDLVLWVGLNDTLTCIISKGESGAGGGSSSGGLELRELKMSGSADDNAYNLETLELMRENKVLPAMNAGDGTLVPITYGGSGQFIMQVALGGIEMQFSLTMAGDGSITMSQDVLAPYVLLTSSKVLEWLTKNKMLAQMGSFEPAFAYYQAQFCLIDYYKATTGDNTKAVVQFNYGSQRFERVYDATTGKEISTTEIPLGGGGSITLDTEMSDTSENAVQNKTIKQYVDSFIPADFNEDFNDDFTN